MIRKFMTTVALGSLFVGGLAASHLAMAQDGAQRGGMRGGAMMMADANKDGNITKAELTAGLEARFAKMDADKDGKLTKADREIMHKQRLDARFARLDADKNGQISKAEYDAAHQARADKRAERRADKGDDKQAGDGKRGGRDGHRWGGRHHRGGADGHGRGMMARGFGGRGGADLSKADFMARPLAMFDKADANKDGTVTTDEMKAARQAMRAERHDRKGAKPAPTSN